MNEEHSIIYRVSMSLDPNGLSSRVSEIEVKETSKSFVAERMRINKERLMRVDTSFIETSRIIRYYTYCREGDQQQALDMLKAHIIEKIKTYKMEVDTLYSFVAKDVTLQ